MSKYFNQKFLILTFILALLFLTNICYAKYTIGIIQYKGGALYNNAKDAFKEHISSNLKDVTFIEKNCEQKLDDSTDKKIEEILAAKPNLIFSLGTGITEYLAGKKSGKDRKVKHKITDIPVVFAIITHPINSGITTSFEKPGGNFTGACVWVKPDLMFKMVKRAGNFKNVLLPSDSLRLGCTKTTIDACKKIGKELGLNFIILDAKDAEEVKTKLPEYINKVDLITVGFDNIAITAMVKGYFAEAQDKMNKPVLSVLPFTLPMTTFTFGTDFTQNGVTAAKKAIQILKDGKKPGDIPIFLEKKPKLGINLKRVKQMKLKISPSLLKTADKIIK